MIDDFASIPYTDAQPAQSATSTVYSALPKGRSRRQVLGYMTAAATGVGLAALDLLPWSKPRSAEAAAYVTWFQCGPPGDTKRYYSPNTTCVPESAYYGSDNCSPNYWPVNTYHRNSSEGTSDSRYIYSYTHNPSSCAGNNAWKWASSSGTKKCSDGWKTRTDTQGSNHYSNFSICRSNV